MVDRNKSNQNCERRCEMSKEEMICDITGEYCENAGSDYCIDCPEFTDWAIGDEW